MDFFNFFPQIVDSRLHIQKSQGDQQIISIVGWDPTKKDGPRARGHG